MAYPPTNKEMLLAWVDENYLWFLEAQEKLWVSILGQDAWDLTYSDEKVAAFKAFDTLVNAEDFRIWKERAYTLQQVADKVDKAALRLELYDHGEVTYYPPGGPVPKGKFRGLSISRSDSTGDSHGTMIRTNGLIDGEVIDSTIDILTGEREIPLVR